MLPLPLIDRCVVFDRDQRSELIAGVHTATWDDVLDVRIEAVVFEVFAITDVVQLLGFHVAV